MKNFLQILKFEYLTCVKNKSFIIITAVLIAIILLTAFLPSIIISIVASNENDENIDGEPPIIMINTSVYDKDTIKDEFLKYYSDYDIKIENENEDSLKKNVDEGKYSFAVVIDDILSYKYITKTNSVFSEETDKISNIIKSIYTVNAFEKYGISKEDTEKIFSVNVKYSTITTGTDITKNYWSSYILMCVLYIAITTYSQLVAQSVVSEKNTRAMELLITCAKPKHLIFGKVFGSGLAGLTQLAIILLVSLGSFGSISSQMIPQKIMDFTSFSFSTVMYALLFFLLGYFMYSFLLGALASFASKSEDLNNLISPIVLVLTSIYVVIIFMTTSENFDNTAMIVMSYLPLTSPMAMFARVSISDVAVWEIVLSTVVQILTIYLIGVLASAIYKIGVLMYGNPPKFNEIIKMLRLHYKENKMLKKNK